MSGSMERHSHISITRTSSQGVTHTDVQITEIGMNADQATEGFNPAAVCSPQECALIEELRAYLRPQEAPERLIAKLEAVLDRCCDAGQIEENSKGESAEDRNQPER